MRRAEYTFLPSATTTAPCCLLSLSLHVKNASTYNKLTKWKEKFSDTCVIQLAGGGFGFVLSTMVSIDTRQKKLLMMNEWVSTHDTYSLLITLLFKAKGKSCSCLFRYEKSIVLTFSRKLLLISIKIHSKKIIKIQQRVSKKERAPGEEMPNCILAGRAEMWVYCCHNSNGFLIHCHEIKTSVNIARLFAGWRDWRCQ